MTMLPWNERLRQERIQRNWRQQELAERLETTVLTISRWERGSHQPSVYFRVKLCALFGKSAEELGFVVVSGAGPDTTEIKADTSPEPFLPASSFPDLWSIPYPRNSFFTGREELLSDLHGQLHREHAMALTQSWAVTGLGGIGKTQVALEYAYRYRQDYRYVFWTRAATRESLLADLVSIADHLRLSTREEQDQNKALQAVKHWFATHEGWLWVLDNVDDLAIVADVLPTEQFGHLLLTTRLQALGALAQRLEVETMGVAEATLFLLRRARLLAPDAFLDQVPEDQLDVAETIAVEMDFLPLALDQAGAYIEEVGCSLAAYLELYRMHRKELLQRRGSVPTDHPESVATTWSLSFEKIERTNPAAAELLRLCAFLDPDNIPEELISEGSAHLGLILGSVATDAFRLNEAIEEVRRFSLVQRIPETRMLRIHRLVQAVLKDAMEKEERCCWAERVVRVTSCGFPEAAEIASWPRCRRFLSQAQLCSGLIEDHAFVFEEAASLLASTANYLYEHVLYEQAESLYEQALRIYEQTLGPAHPKLANPLIGLAFIYRRRDEYKQAELLYQRALCIREQMLGPNHPDVAEVLHNLGILYKKQGKYEQAEPLYQRALHIRELVLGPEHPDVATTLNNLAILFHVQGKYREAEPLHQRVLHIRELVLGSEHPDVAAALNNLAILYYLEEKYEEAEPLYQRALQIWEQALGPDHPNLAFALTNLADTYQAQKKYEEAEPLYRRALRIWEQVFGSEHSLLAHPLKGLGNLYREQGKQKEAKPLYQRALSIQEHTPGQQHPDTAETLHDFAIFQEAEGQIEEALSLYQRALAIREQVLGSEHPDTAATRTRYTALLQAQGCSQEKAPFPLHDGVDSSPSQDNHVQMFLDTCCERHPRAWCQASDLWQVYQQWTAERQERFPLSRHAFTAQLKALGCHAARTNTARIWRGIGIVKNQLRREMTDGDMAEKTRHDERVTDAANKGW